MARTLVREEQVREYLEKLDIFNSSVPNEILRRLALAILAISETLAAVFENSWFGESAETKKEWGWFVCFREEQKQWLAIPQQFKFHFFGRILE